MSKTVVASLLLLASLIGLAGCSYLETQRQRPISPDTRIELGWQDRVSLYGRDMRRYKCAADYSLRCDRGGAITYSCTCALR